jgi:predicted nucleic acid-binding protein
MTDSFADEMVLVDTNIVSFIFKEDSRRVLYEPHVNGRLTAIAAQTYAELELLPLSNNWSAARHKRLIEYVESEFILLEATRDVGLKWAHIQFNAKRIGKPMGVADSWIAATALAFSIPLVTHNYKDFKNVQHLYLITENK